MGSGGGERSNEPPSNHCAINSNVKEEKRVLSWTVLVVAVFAERVSRKDPKLLGEICIKRRPLPC
jgi:hypothetical protein